ncbi:MAG TPA: hypothetical protein VFR37_23315 [Longimicrobium sp.]|nr:hypothetical protein [Longimicrobium sp.]
MDDRPADSAPTAWIILPGHPDAPAHVSVQRYSRAARLYRTTWFAFLWMVSTVGMFFVTIFDPFMTSMPLLLGGMMTYRSWRGRFRVMEFSGACPRCHSAIAIKPGSRIGTPHHLVCYSCHHEPELYLAA